MRKKAHTGGHTDTGLETVKALDLLGWTFRRVAAAEHIIAEPAGKLDAGG